jgi:hypothetical protein
VDQRLSTLNMSKPPIPKGIDPQPGPAPTGRPCAGADPHQPDRLLGTTKGWSRPCGRDHPFVVPVSVFGRRRPQLQRDSQLQRGTPIRAEVGYPAEVTQPKHPGDGSGSADHDGQRTMTRMVFRALSCSPRWSESWISGGITTPTSSVRIRPSQQVDRATVHLLDLHPQDPVTDPPAEEPHHEHLDEQEDDQRPPRVPGHDEVGQARRDGQSMHRARILRPHLATEPARTPGVPSVGPDNPDHAIGAGR